MTSELRSPTDCERAILDVLLSADFPGRDTVRALLADAEVRTIDEDGSLEIICTSPLKAEVVKQVPVEAYATDADGVTAEILLHVRNGKPVELEVFKRDASTVSSLEALRNFDVQVYPPYRSRI